MERLMWCYVEEAWKPPICHPKCEQIRRLTTEYNNIVSGHFLHEYCNCDSQLQGIRGEIERIKKGV